MCVLWGLLLGIICQADQIWVHAGDNLQAAIDSARYGDEVVIDAGAVFQGPIILRNKGPVPQGMTDEQAYITIRSSRLSELPSSGTRVGPQHAPLMPAITGPGSGTGALQTEAGAHHYKFVGVEFRPVDENAFIYDLILLGRGGFADGQNTLEEVPHHFIINRCYIHAFPNQELKRGIALNSGYTEITDSYVSGFKGRGQDAQAICGWNGTGPYLIENNYLEGSGENVLFGGADTAIPNNVPSDIVFRRNHVKKPLEWMGVWTVKNSLELKNARRVLIEGNIFENCWGDAQVGYAIVFTPRNQDGRNPWAVVEDVVFRHNIVKYTASGISILGADYANPSQRTKRITIENNLLIGGAPGGNGTGILFSGYAQDVRIVHNTLHFDNTAIMMDVGDASQYPDKNARLTVLNNIFTWRGVGGGPYTGIDALNWGATDWQYVGNVYIDSYGSGACPPGYPCYPAGNYQVSPSDGIAYIKFTDVSAGNYRLRSDSPFKGRVANKHDLGCNFDLLDELIRGVDR